LAQPALTNDARSEPEAESVITIKVGPIEIQLLTFHSTLRTSQSATALGDSSSDEK
jgi:hypothetical protein